MPYGDEPRSFEKERETETPMNTIGITNSLDRPRVRKLLATGLGASVITGVGDFLLGFAEETRGTGLAANVLANAASASDAQLIWGGLLGLVGIFLEGLSFFGVYRLMADKAPRYAHAYRTGIFGYIWLAPVGCHMNVGLMTLAYKYLLTSDVTLAEHVGDELLMAFAVPVWILLVAFWVPMIVVQFRAFSKGMTPYPRYARWFNLIVGAVPPLVVAALLGPGTALGAAIGTTFLSCGNALTFGGLLATLPSEERFEEFRRELRPNAGD